MANEEIMNNAENVAVAAIRKPRKKTAEDDDIEVSNKKLAIGSVYSNDHVGLRYGLDEIQAIELPVDFKGQVELARLYYTQEGVVKTTIDLMADFSTTGMKNVTKQKTVKKFFDTLCKYSDMDSLFRYIFLEYYISGDVFIYRGDKKIVDEGPDKGAIYYPYTVLNPISVEVEGDLMFGGEVYTLTLPTEVRTILANKKDRRYKEIISKLPKELRNPKFSEEGNLILPSNRVSRICYKKQPYERRPTPFMAGAFMPIALKRRLREMDLATAEGTINSLMVVKVGNDKFPATKAQLEAIAELFKTGAKSYQLFWNHTLEVQKIEADLTAMGDEKYRQVNRDIMAALGMPSVLINGGDEGGRFANAWASIVALIERLESGRAQVKRWLESEYRTISEENNIKEPPKVEFDRMNLREERVFKDILMGYYDRGLLDIETMLEDSGYDYEQIKQRKKDQEDDKELFESPYGGAAPPVSPKAPSPPKPTVMKPGGEGRPKTELDPNYTERPPQEGPKMRDEQDIKKKTKEK